MKLGENLEGRTDAEVSLVPRKVDAGHHNAAMKRWRRSGVPWEQKEGRVMKIDEACDGLDELLS